MRKTFQWRYHLLSYGLPPVVCFSPGVQTPSTLPARSRSLRIMGVILILLVILAGTFFGMSSVSVNYRYLAIMVAVVAGITMLFFLCRMATDRQGCFATGCCKTDALTCCTCCRPRTGTSQPDWSHVRSRTVTGPHARLDTELIRDLRKTESHLLGLLFIMDQLRANAAREGSGHDQELMDLLQWYVRTEYTVLSSWVEGRSPCTRDDVTRMRCRLGFMCSQGPLAIGARSHAYAPSCPVDASYEQW